MWGATAVGSVPVDDMRFQSTLPVWGATGFISGFLRSVIISIHAPRVGSDVPDTMLRRRPDDFNPRSPCGERLASTGQANRLPHFNPRSPCGERPRQSCVTVQPQSHFNPRSPCGERRDTARSPAAVPPISIHAPRVGSDSRAGRCSGRAQNFNPRSPCGERL